MTSSHAAGHDETSNTSAFSKLEFLLGKRRGSVAILAASSVLSGFTEAGILAVVAQVAASLVAGATRVHVNIGPLHNTATIGVLLGVAIALCLMRLALALPLSYLPAQIAAEVQARLRNQLFNAFTRASWAVQSRDREGHLQEIMTSQVLQASQGALQTTVLVSAVLTSLVLIVSALALNITAAIVVLIAAIALFALLRPLNALGSRRARALSQSQMDYASGVGEAIRVSEETQVFGVASAQQGRMEDFTRSAQDHFFHTQFLGRLIPNVYQSLIYLIIVVGLAALHLAGKGDVASLGAVVLLLVRAGTYGQQIQGSYQFVRQALPFVERLQSVELHYLDSTPNLGDRPLPKVKTLAFESVSYSYRVGREALSDVSFEVLGGESVGIVGPSGAGKSTAVQILLQLRSPDQGSYLMNSVPVDQYAPTDWRKRVAYVPQEPHLIHASVADNIRYFRAIDSDAIERASRLAHIHDDIASWPQKYETIVGPRADAVSGGQQQRICLARALAAQPALLVLDEPTSALDPNSESLIQRSLEGLKGQVTLFIIAHRMSTLDLCDRVMVIVDGRLEAFDTAEHLLQINSYYRSASSVTPDATEGTL